MNMLINQIFCFLSVYFYKASASVNDSSNLLSDKAWFIVTVLFCFSIFCFSFFILKINKDYRWTFADTQTGKKFVVDNFTEAETDEMKFDVFTHHPSYYYEVNNKIKIWLAEKWDTWEDEKPEWFTAQAISEIPADILPEKVLAKLGGAKGRRRSLDAMMTEEKVEQERRKSLVQERN